MHNVEWYGPESSEREPTQAQVIPQKICETLPEEMRRET